jgi:hypothetical protein
MMRTESYSRLWGYGNKRANEDWSPFKSDEEAKKFRDALYQRLKKQGVVVKRSTMKGQIRQYWDFMQPCGDSCTVYELHYNVD